MIYCEDYVLYSKMEAVAILQFKNSSLQQYIKRSRHHYSGARNARRTSQAPPLARIPRARLGHFRNAKKKAAKWPVLQANEDRLKRL